MKNELINEAGVWYRFPRTSDEKPTFGLSEFQYRRWRNGMDFGSQRIFIETVSPMAFYMLLDHWNLMSQGQKSCFTYTAESPVL